MVGPPAGYADPDLDRQISAASDRLNQLVEDYDAARENLTATEAQVKSVNAAVAPLQASTDRLINEVGGIAAGIYRTTGANPVSALLIADNPAALMSNLALLDHLARGRQRKIDELTATRQRLQTQQRTLAALQRQQVAQATQLGEQQATVEAEVAKLHAMRANAGPGRTSRAGYRDNFVPVFTSDAGGRAVRYAYAQLGKPYQWAADGPDSYDCSGLTLAAWRAAGKTLPHSSRMQWSAVTKISRDQLKPGDLVFYYRDIHHVAIYAGGGRVISAPQEGDLVSIAPIDMASIYGYGRVK